MEPGDIQRALESLLLVSDKPLTQVAVTGVTGLSAKQVREGFEALGGVYRDGVNGMVLHEVAGGWQLRTCASTAHIVKRFLQVKPQRLTRAAIETLAIVAYRQPVTRPEVEEIRGVDCGAVMRSLLERELVQVLGKKEEPGRPLLYGTTRVFLEFFDLKDLASLPTLREFHELDEEHEKIVEDRYPDADAASLLEGMEEEALAKNHEEDDLALEDIDAAIRDARKHSRNIARVLQPDDDSLEDEGEGEASEDHAAEQSTRGGSAEAPTDGPEGEASS